MDRRRLALLGLLLALVALFFVFDLGQYLDLARLKAEQAALEAQVAARPWRAAGLFLLVYVATTALSLPGAALLSLVAGALFGLLAGSVLVSLASTLGACLAMLSSRFVLRDWVQRRFGPRLAAIDRGIARDGAFYLFALRLVPAFPFFLINLAMGLTRLPLRTFAWVSQLGMLPGTLVYVNAGRELGRLDSLAGILSPGLLGAFALLGLFPLLARLLLERLKARRVYAGWQRPRHFERNLVVIGAGSGGLVSAYLAAALQARVTLIEKGQMGGDCLNRGCVPSKALLRSARVASELRKAASLGWRASGEADFAAVMERVQRVIGRIEPHDSAERYRDLGVEVLHGEARLVSPWAVEVAGRRLTARAIVIATGAHPLLPEIPGLERVEPLTSDTVWSLRQRPQRLLVLGGGPLGCELAQAFQRLGCRVTLVEMAERLLLREDPEASAAVQAALVADGVDLRLRHQALRFEALDGGRRLVCHDQAGGAEVLLGFDRVLLALGRVANVSGFGAETLGLALRANGTLETDEYLATRFPNIYAVGDVTGPWQFTHVAAHQAKYAALNALFGRFWRFKADYRVIPWATFTEPEVARVGLNEQEARTQGIAVEVTRFDLAELDRAIADEAASGFVKVLSVPGRDRILGVTLVGEHAGDLLGEFVAAMRHGHGLKQVLGTLHIYPTLAEANQYAAGAWQRAHVSPRLLRVLKGLQRWQRGRRGPARHEPPVV
ncbi:FAD-dependent oxidoreductase [Pseudomonas sp. MAP12]|uniref:FAD-dependent oxidoreductase n=1 Tax=Geopseudomonas aromaticivorans TaxID=2849492 RepID=A0ABS6MV26_9GAMM|nr:FAD-dependent oxidoreductase [Pseudomonas aromaticivorans]